MYHFIRFGKIPFYSDLLVDFPIEHRRVLGVPLPLPTPVQASILSSPRSGAAGASTPGALLAAGAQQFLGPEKSTGWWCQSSELAFSWCVHLELQELTKWLIQCGPPPVMFVGL
jgi:hypothetical protein